jgi:hypothetical protein
MIEGKPLVLLQIKCKSIHNKTLNFLNLIDTYNPDVVIGTESWLSEGIKNAEVFRADYTTFRRDRHTRGDGVFVCVKNNITCARPWVDEVYEIIAVEVKGREILGIYRAPKEDMRLLEKLAGRTRYMERTTKHSIIGGDLSSPYADGNSHAEKSRGIQVFLNRLIWENGYTQVINSPTRGDALLTFTFSGPKVRSLLAVIF